MAALIVVVASARPKAPVAAMVAVERATDPTTARATHPEAHHNETTDFPVMTTAPAATRTNRPVHTTRTQRVRGWDKTECPASPANPVFPAHQAASRTRCAPAST